MIVVIQFSDIDIAFAEIPAPEGFYFEASRSSVTVAAARHDYSMHWSPCACRTPAMHTGSENPPGNPRIGFAAQI
jgi:hypothetical protein